MYVGYEPPRLYIRSPAAQDGGAVRNFREFLFYALG